MREELKQQFQRQVSDLIARINEIAASINAATSKEILVIIDDLDKLDLAVAREIYQDNIKALLKPNFSDYFNYTRFRPQGNQDGGGDEYRN